MHTTFSAEVFQTCCCLACSLLLLLPPQVCSACTRARKILLISRANDARGANGLFDVPTFLVWTFQTCGNDSYCPFACIAQRLPFFDCKLIPYPFILK